MTRMDAPLSPGRTLRPADGGILSALPPGDEGAPYDRRAVVYDRLIGSPLYNRLAWGTHPSQYASFATEALAAGDGPYLDAGCGTLVFTAAAYRRATRPLVLVDRSLGMLRRGAERLGGAPATLVQADIHDLPFERGHFTTIGCFAMLHVLSDPWAALAGLRERLPSGGRLFASMLVADGSAAYLKALHRAGEVGPPRRTAELATTARSLFGGSVQVGRTGSMAWLRATAP
jgi:SAM-dependent methyltransferase